MKKGLPPGKPLISATFWAVRPDMCCIKITRKIDFIIGNPPYQDETLGDNKGFAPPIYHMFLDGAYEKGTVVELIHPARFLFNAGSTPKQWNQKMLDDPHLKVLHYEQDASTMFHNTEIKGGVVITYHDTNKSFGAIEVFSPYPEMNTIMHKAAPKSEEESLMSIIYVQNRFNLDALYQEYPEYEQIIGSNGKDKRFRNNIFDKIPLFTDDSQNSDDIAVIGVVKNKRQWRYFPIRFTDTNHENLYKWKLLVVRVNGTGAIGEVLSTPIIAKPNEGYTQTFIGIGAFDGKAEAENALKYVKSKFMRTMLGILKITQDNNRKTWRMVPLQDFTPSSDIDWTKPIPEIDRHGFISNFLFQNISNVFGAPGIVKEIVGKLTPAQEDPKKNKRDAITRMDEVPVDEDGNVDIPKEIVIGKTRDLFGEKIYDTMRGDVESAVASVSGGTADEIRRQVQNVAETVKETIMSNVVQPVTDAYDVKKATRSRVERQVEQEIEKTFERLQGDYIQQTNIAKAELDHARKTAETTAEVKQAEAVYQSTMENALQTFTETMQDEVKRAIEEKPKELVEQMERHKAEEEKRTVEDDIRAHLRGFARTIPSFIMAYGDDGLNLSNFDDYTEADVFLEVTGITEDDFRFLRDGGEYTDPETGEKKHFAGNLFDEVVFNDSIREFLRKKRELADYFDETQDEDIFDYIPPQKTNQIFTPKWVVAMMVDELEKNNPGCFDDPANTFADLYMKSGLYITEIVKRLYRSEKMKALYPDDQTRIRHILNEQVYGMAPTRIIYLISTNYILGFDDSLKNAAHFVQADAAKAAKEGTLDKLVNRYF